MKAGGYWCYMYLTKGLAFNNINMNHFDKRYEPSQPVVEYMKLKYCNLLKAWSIMNHCQY